MATASNSPPALIESENSPRNSHSQMPSVARGVQSLCENSRSPSLSGNADPERHEASPVFVPSDSFSSGEVSTPVAAASCSTEDGFSATAGAYDLPESSENGVATKKQVWNKTSNGAAAEVGAVMGADSWPALSKSAHAPPKASSTDNPKALSHGSPTSSQGVSIGSLSSQKDVNTGIPATNSTSNHVAPTRNRSMKRGGGGSNHSSVTSNGNLSQAPPVHDFVVEASSSNPGKSSSSAGESPRDNMNGDSGQRGGSYAGNESHQQGGSFRRSNSGPQLRGDGSFHHGHGRRDQERGRQDWSSSQRTYGSRDGPAPQQRVGPRPFIRGPISNTPFIPPPPIAAPPFVPPMVFNEMTAPMFYPPGLYPDSYRYMPMFPFAPMFYPPYDPHLPSKIARQINYYFSGDNLAKDTFLRKNMDGDGWVSIKLIASFKKITELTDNVQLILDAIQASNVVEVQGDKVRCKNDWNKWIMHPVIYSAGTSSQSLQSSSQDMLAAHIQNVSLDEKSAT